MAEDLIPYEEFVLRVGTGLLGGALVGLERERAQLSARGKKGGGIPGFRSMGLVGLYGSLASVIASSLGPPEAISMLLLPAAAIGLLVLIYAYARMVKGGTYGFTTYLVILLTFLIGVLAGLGMVLEAASVSVAVSLLLALKDPVVRLARSISYPELVAMLEVAALIVIVGPLVRTYSTLIPWIDVFDAYLFFTAVVAISFSSYAAARIWGSRGVIAGAFLASMVNSEAVISSIVSRGPLSGSTAAMATALVASAMQLRSSALAGLALVLAGVREPGAYLALALLASIALAAARYAHQNLSKNPPPQATPASPLDWAAAARGAAAFLLLASTAKLAAGATGGQGGLLTAALLGLLGGAASATAALLALATVAEDLGAEPALAGMLLSIHSATLNKILYARASGATGETLRGVAAASIALSIPPLALALAAAYTALYKP